MTPQIGAFGVVRTEGWGAAVIRAVTNSPVNHAFVHVGDGVIVEAQPKGARTLRATHYPNAIWSHRDLQGHGPAIAAAARRLVGTPYSWVDVVCIGLADLFGWHVPAAVRKRLSRRGELMCSQLVDTAYHDGGIELFTDGRIPGDVAPSDLYDLITKE